MKNVESLSCAVALGCALTVSAQPDFSVFSIAVNQAGWRPEAPKWCMATNPPAMDFVVQTIGTDVWWRTVHRGRFVPSGTTNGVFQADLSAIRKPGDYRILCGDERENRGGCEGGLLDGMKTVVVRLPGHVRNLRLRLVDSKGANRSVPVTFSDGRVTLTLERLSVAYLTWTDKRPES